MAAKQGFDQELTEDFGGNAFFPASQEASMRAEIASLRQELAAGRNALSEHEERLDLTLESAKAGMWDWDPLTDRLTWTPQMERLYETDPNSVSKYDDWRSRVHPDDVDKTEAERDAVLRERRPFDLEFRIVLPSGEVRWLAARGRGHYDEAGELTRVTGINQDITARKAKEAERDARDARLRAQWESTPLASFLWKNAGADLVLVEVNPAAERMTHGKAHEFLGLTAAQIYSDRPDLIERFRACLDQKDTFAYSCDYRTRGSGVGRHIEFTFAYVAPDSVLLHCEDVTELRRTETDLQFTQTVVDRMNDAVYWAGEDGRLVYVNEAACAMLGYTRDEFLSRRVHDLVENYIDARWMAHWDDLRQHGRLRFETCHRRKDGSSVPVEVQTQIVTYGDRTYACGIARDISNGKAMEAALRASETKFSALFELSPIALTITRVADGVFLNVNDEFLHLSGFARAEVIGRTALDLKLYAEPAQRDAIIAEVRRTGQASGWPVMIRTKDGSTSDCLMSVTVEAIDGVPCFLAGIVHLGPLRQAEAALRASEAKFASFFESSPVAMSISRGDDGRFVAINTTFEEATGYTRADVVGRTALELNLYADPVERAAMLAEVGQSGVVRAQPIKFRTREGALIECLISVNTVPVDGVECYLAGIINIQPQRMAESALRDQRAAMLALLENTDSSIWSIDRSYRLTACNSVFQHNLRASLSRNFTTGDSVLQSDEETNAEWRAMYDRVLAGERLVIDVQRRHSRRGSWMEYRFSPVRDAGGAVTGVTVLGRDITERIQAAEQIEAQLAEISFYYDTAPVGLAVLDTDLRFLRINKSLAEMNGVSVEEHIGKEIEDVVPLIADQARQIATQVLATGKPVKDIEIAGETPADPGVTHYWSEHWYPIMRSGGTVVGFNVTVEDITERKVTHERLERSQQNLAHAQQIGHLGSWEWDVPGNRLEWSDELYRIFGVDRSFELTYAGVEAMLHPEDREPNNAMIASALATDDESASEFRIIRPDGELRYIHQSIEIVRDAAGAPSRLFGIMQDITERKRAEEAHVQLQAQLAQAQKMETVGRLAGGIAHDFNNLLAVILLRSELALQMATADTPLHRSLNAIHTTAQRSASLVQQLLGYARKQTIAPKVVDLNAIVEGLLPTLRRLIGEEIELAWTPDVDVWPVKMDTSQVDQILANLCVNARDAIDGIGTISVKTANAVLTGARPGAERGVEQGEYVLLSVSDTGRGMAPDVLEHIFEPFFTTKGVGKGVGLGLATVDGIVQQNGGHIKVTSKPGAGTTFTVYLPRHAAPVAPMPAPEKLSQPVMGAGKTVLVVEDEAAVLDMAAEVLRAYGFAVLAALTPSQALRLAAEYADRIDLLLTDVIMSVMNGAELAALIQAMRPGIKTMFMSGYPADHVAHRGVLPDDAHFLAKPFAVQTLAGKAQEILNAPARSPEHSCDSRP